MLKINKTARLRRFAVLLVILVGLLALGYGAWQLAQAFMNPVPAVFSAPVPKPSPTVASATSIMLIMGDI